MRMLKPNGYAALQTIYFGVYLKRDAPNWCSFPHVLLLGTARLHDSGFCLLYKRLEKGRFQWPRCADTTWRCSARELAWLLEGLSLLDLTSVQRLNFTEVAHRILCDSEQTCSLPHSIMWEISRDLQTRVGDAREDTKKAL